MRDWVQGSNGAWCSMGVISDQFNGAYGVPGGLMFSYPVTCDNGSYSLVEGLEIDDYSAKMIKITADELQSERDAVQHLL